MPQVQAPRRNTAPFLLLLSHVYRTLTQIASSLLTLLWQSMKWIFVFIIVAVVASVLASIVYTYFATGSVTFVNFQKLSIIQTLQAHILLDDQIASANKNLSVSGRLVKS